MLQKSITFYPQLFISLVILLVFSACSGDNTNSSTVEKPEVSSETEKETQSSGGCCFSVESEFAQFIPKGSSRFITTSDKFSCRFFCEKDQDRPRATASNKYQVDTTVFSDPLNYKYISVEIEDYCGMPDELKAKQERMRKTAMDGGAKSTNITVADIKEDGLYYGYTYLDVTKGNNSQNFLINVVVDDRFRVSVTGIDHTRLDLGMELLKQVPLKELASFGK